MKAKTIEIPTPVKMLLLALAISITLVSITSLQAAEITSLAKAEDHRYFSETISFEKQRSSSEILQDIDKGAKKLNQIKQIEQANEQKRLDEMKDAEDAEVAKQQAAEAAYLAQLQADEARYQEVGVCSVASSKKTYMDYRSIHPNSTQMAIINAQLSVNEDGLLVTSDGFIGVALGSRYGKLGDKFRITTDTGQVIKVIKIDAKSDAHTQNGCHDASGAMIEFVIDISRVNSAYPQVTFSGDFNVLSRFSGNTVRIESYQ